MKSNFSKDMLMTALVTGTVLCSSVAAFAEELQEYSLDQMVVTAQRTEKDDVDTPASVKVITEKELTQSGATNLYDGLKLANGITSYGYGANGQAWGGMSAKILIRGNDKGTLVMIDGAPINMNNVYFLNTLPVEAVERIEIVKGASSVLYGSEASSGVINIITKKQMQNSISLSKAEYGKTREGISLGLGKLGIVANLEQGDELKGYASNGRAMNDGKKSSVMWKYKFDDKWTVSHQHTDNDYQFNQYDTATWKTLKEDSSFKYKEDFARIQYNDGSLKGNLYYNRSDRHNNTYKIKKGTASKWKIEHITFDTLGLDLQKEFNTKVADIIVGTTLEQQTYKCDNPYSGGKLVNQKLDKDAKTYAFFVQATRDLGNDFTATIGAREQFLKANDNYNAFTPEFSLIKKLDQNSSIYLNAAKAFKMPNFTSLYGSGSVEFKPNPELKPEEGWTYELGYKKASNSSMFKTAIYYIDMDAWSYKADSDGVNQAINSPFENLGLEVNYEKNVGEHFSYSLGTDISNPKSRDAGKWTRKFAREQYTASLKYNNRDFTASLAGSMTADRAGGWKDRLPLNLYTSYQLSKDHRIDLVCENILNRNDLVGNWSNANSTRYYSLPRNIRLTYTYTF